MVHIQVHSHSIAVYVDAHCREQAMPQGQPPLASLADDWRALSVLEAANRSSKARTDERRLSLTKCQMGA